MSIKPTVISLILITLDAAIILWKEPSTLGVEGRNEISQEAWVWILDSCWPRPRIPIAISSRLFDSFAVLGPSAPTGLIWYARGPYTLTFLRPDDSVSWPTTFFIAFIKSLDSSTSNYLCSEWFCFIKFQELHIFYFISTFMSDSLTKPCVLTWAPRYSLLLWSPILSDTKWYAARVVRVSSLWSWSTH